MSTSAIIGIRHEDGSVLGAWQWNDGDSIVAELKARFNTPEKATALINEGTWSTMFTTEEAIKFDSWFLSELRDPWAVKTLPYTYVEIEGIKLLKHPHHEGKAPEVYASVEDALGQDINFLYLFDPATAKWQIYK